MSARDFIIWRKKLKHTQATLAQCLGMSLRQIIRYERGETPIPDVVWMALRSVPSRKRNEEK